METMTPKERIDAVIKHQAVDRTPFTVVDGGAWIAKTEGVTYRELWVIPSLKKLKEKLPFYKYFYAHVCGASGNRVAAFHFLAASAKSPSGPTSVSSDHPLINEKLNAFTPSANCLSELSMPSGTFT